MRYLVLMLLPLVLAACQKVAATPVYDKNGKAIYFVECVDSLTRCYVKANEICPDGYKTLSESDGVNVSGADGFQTNGNASVYASSRPVRNIKIACD